MARVSNRFYDASDSTEYLWPLNHSEEEAIGEERPITETAVTSGIGVVRQQGAEAPLKILLRGTVLDPAQHAAFIAWRRRCRTHTIQFRDFAGDVFEVLITSYKPQRQAVLRNPRGGSTAPLHIWKYTMELDVISVISGTWA